MRLTGEYIKSLVYTKTRKKPDGTEAHPSQVFWDDAIPGFGVRVSQTGRKSFVYRYKIGGVQRTSVLGTYGQTGRYGTLSVQDARALALQWQARINEAADPLSERRTFSRDMTLSRVCREYQDEVARPRAQAIIRCHILPALGHKNVKKITEADVNRLVNNVGISDGKVCTANMILEEIRSIFEFARAKNYVDVGHLNPTDNLRRLKKPNSYSLSNDDLTVLARAIDSCGNDIVRLVIWFHVFSGLPFKSLLEARWSDIRGEFLQIDNERVLLSGKLKVIVDCLLLYRTLSNHYLFPEFGRRVPLLNLDQKWRDIKASAVAHGGNKAIAYVSLPSTHGTFKQWVNLELETINENSIEAIRAARRPNKTPSPMPEVWRPALSPIPTLSDAFCDLREYKKLKAGTLAYYDKLLHIYLKEWLDKPITSITRDDVRLRHAFITQSCGPCAANVAMRVLSSIFTYSQFRYRKADGQPLIAESPVLILSRLRIWNRLRPKRTTIRPVELARWYEAVMRCSSEDVRDSLMLILFTGLRKNEAYRLGWSSVNFAERTLTIVDPKNGRDLTLPLSSFVFDLLKKRHRRTGKSAWVFPNKHGTGPTTCDNNSYKLIAANCDIDFSPHSLRRCFVGVAHQIKIDIYTIKHILNHVGREDVTFNCYSLTHVDDLREPMERICQALLYHLQPDRFEVVNDQVSNLELNSFRVALLEDVCEAELVSQSV
ncbi:MAG TPA: tyrosine-type recombinase/integrase [Oculatellaceae cyanobacterium]